MSKHDERANFPAMTALPTELHELPLQEKLDLLDLLWSDIRTSPGYEPPSWHEAVVRERIAEFHSGKVHIHGFGVKVE